MRLHVQAGHEDLPFPYQWNSPYPGVAGNTHRAHEAKKHDWAPEMDIGL